MYKNKNMILNSELNKWIAQLGHTQTLVIADAGLPIPKNMPLIDLALVVGTPSFEEVFNVVISYMAVDQITYCKETKEDNKKTFALLEKSGIKLNQLKNHEEFKVATKNSSMIIRTGEVSAYSNVIVHAGVNF